MQGADNAQHAGQAIHRAAEQGMHIHLGTCRASSGNTVLTGARLEANSTHDMGAVNRERLLQCSSFF